MATRSFTRAAFIAALAGAGLVATAPIAHAARDQAAEQYVQESASRALETLGDRSLSATQRQQTFTRLMSDFADMPRISTYVLGRYGGELRANAALRSEWRNTFQAYAIATYETRLERFSGSSIRVTGSRIVREGVVDVASQVTPHGQDRPMLVQWRLYRSGGGWKVFDLQLAFEGGNAIWLGAQQQLDFLAILDRNNGDIQALMTVLRGQTASMRQRIVARS
ncbi:MAG: MlaC/ttg2D family ABC transporter substrate-binding protein [Caulobacteraceae bacterium]